MIAIYWVVIGYLSNHNPIYSNDLWHIALKLMTSMKVMMYASKQLEGTTPGDINNAHEYNIMKPLFIMGIHAFLLFKRYKGPKYRLYWASAWRELPDCLIIIAGHFLPCCLWEAPASPELLLQHCQLAQVRAGPRLLPSLVGLGLALDMQNH